MFNLTSFIGKETSFLNIIRIVTKIVINKIISFRLSMFTCIQLSIYKHTGVYKKIVKKYSTVGVKLS